MSKRAFLIASLPYLATALVILAAGIRIGRKRLTNRLRYWVIVPIASVALGMTISLTATISDNRIVACSGPIFGEPRLPPNPECEPGWNAAAMKAFEADPHISERFQIFFTVTALGLALLTELWLGGAFLGRHVLRRTSPA